MTITLTDENSWTCEVCPPFLKCRIYPRTVEVRDKHYEVVRARQECTHMSYGVCPVCIRKRHVPGKGKAVDAGSMRYRKALHWDRGGKHG